MKYSLFEFNCGIEAVLRDPTIKTATVFCSPLVDVKNRIRVTRKGKDQLIITYGRPNYREREFLKLCKKAKTQPRKIIFKFFKKKS